jgi:hypothetical protein
MRSSTARHLDLKLLALGQFEQGNSLFLPRIGKSPGMKAIFEQ